MATPTPLEQLQADIAAAADLALSARAYRDANPRDAHAAEYAKRAESLLQAAIALRNIVWSKTAP